jgi:hypothetical protein
LIETISPAEEPRCGRGAATVSLPIVATMTFDTAADHDGLTCEAAMRPRDDLAVRPVRSAPIAAPARRSRSRACWADARRAPGDAIVAKATGLPHYHDGEIRYDGTPEIMATTPAWRALPGHDHCGCCGTMPQHIEPMAMALATRPEGPPPTGHDRARPRAARRRSCSTAAARQAARRPGAGALTTLADALQQKTEDRGLAGSTREGCTTRAIRCGGGLSLRPTSR